MSRSRNLVVVRAGDASLHETWLDGRRDWDMIVSYYDEDPDRFRREGIPRIDAKGGKLEGLHALFVARPDLLRGYDYIWLPDDDIATSCAVINRLFATTAERKLSLSQPGLSPDSHVLAAQLIANPEFSLRFTDFVEMMIPCFEAGFLARIVHLFEGLRFGGGLDNFWARMMPQPRGRTAIIDACQMTHTRASGTGPLYRTGDWRAEWDRVHRFFGAPHRRKHVVYGGITREGRVLGRGPAFAWRAIKGIRAVAPTVRRKRYARRALKCHLIHRDDLAELPIPDRIPEWRPRDR